MTRIGNFLRRWLAVVALMVALPAQAQQAAWVQIEARPTLAQAEDRARAYAGQFENVVGYRLASGWYAIALGPYQPALADSELARLRSARAIPGDSYISDGGIYRDQFWPVGAEGAGRPNFVVPPEPTTPVAAPPPIAADESPAEARAAERNLTRPEREELQRALQAGGFYRSRIDGSFGPGTRRSMSAWQAAQGFETTGILTTKQRAALLGEYRDAIGTLGLVRVVDAKAGIEITLPLDEVAFAEYEAPFARYEGDEAQVLLISQSGDADTLRGLYDVIQTLEIVPLAGDRNFGRGRFQIDGANARIITRIEAVLTSDGVKGFALVWPADDAMRRGLALEAMQASFTPVDGVVLPDSAGTLSEQSPDLLAGLQIRKPEVSASGFFVDGSGTVLTAASVVQSCSRITLDGETEAEVSVSDSNLNAALLVPKSSLVPIAFGRIRAELPRLNSEIAVAGYSYGGVLGVPTISFGTIEDVRGLNGEEPLARLALSVRPGDAGGPVLDTAGGVLGMLLPRADDQTQTLPDEVQFAADNTAIASFLAEQGISLVDPAPTDPLAPEDIALIGADMTVLVECWN